MCPLSQNIQNPQFFGVCGSQTPQKEEKKKENDSELTDLERGLSRLNHSTALSSPWCAFCFIHREWKCKVIRVGSVLLLSSPFDCAYALQNKAISIWTFCLINKPHEQEEAVYTSVCGSPVLPDKRVWGTKVEEWNSEVISERCWRFCPQPIEIGGRGEEKKN